MAALSGLDNVAVKVSGWRSLADFDEAAARRHVHALARMYGSERLLFGSDWPVSLLGGRYGDVVADIERWTLTWSESERNNLWWGSAQRWYRLPGC